MQSSRSGWTMIIVMMMKEALKMKITTFTPHTHRQTHTELIERGKTTKIFLNNIHPWQRHVWVWYFHTHVKMMTNTGHYCWVNKLVTLSPLCTIIIILTPTLVVRWLFKIFPPFRYNHKIDSLFNNIHYTFDDTVDHQSCETKDRLSNIEMVANTITQATLHTCHNNWCQWSMIYCTTHMLQMITLQHVLMLSCSSGVVTEVLMVVVVSWSGQDM